MATKMKPKMIYLSLMDGSIFMSLFLVITRFCSPSLQNNSILPNIFHSLRLEGFFHRFSPKILNHIRFSYSRVSISGILEKWRVRLSSLRLTVPSINEPETV